MARSRDATTHEKRGRSTSIPIGSDLRSTRRSSTATRPFAPAGAALAKTAATNATASRIPLDMCLLSPCAPHLTTNAQIRS